MMKSHVGCMMPWLLLLACLEAPLPAQAPPPYAPLDAVQLNQLVAPIALYPDALVAQVLTASTYSQQVGEAANWVRQYGNMPPDQIANAVNGMPWDPSVKALTEFPSVLDNMARNYNWTAALGNAYYNQPGDVMNAVQAMRYQAQQAGALRSTPQQRVYMNGGLVVIEPVNPAFVYVPYYDPWRVYGVAISPWGGYYVAPPPRGFVAGVGFGIGFGLGVSLGVFSHYGWGYHAWAPNWGGGVVVYNHTTYISRSTTVVNYGHFGGYNRGVYERAGPGVPHNFRPAVTERTAQWNRGGSAPAPAYRPAGGATYGGGYNRGAGTPAPAVNRPQGSYQPQSRPQGSYQPQGSNQPQGRPEGSYEPQGRPQGSYQPQGRPQGSYQPQGSNQPQGRPQGSYQPQARPQAQQAPAPRAEPNRAQPHPEGRPQGAGGHQARPEGRGEHR